MTVEKCQTVLDEIRQRQGTDRPLIRVKTGASVLEGRIANEPTMPIAGRNPNSPFGLLRLEQMGLARGPISFVQIANIPDDGIAAVDHG
jgi:hypothetical protein